MIRRALGVAASLVAIAAFGLAWTRPPAPLGKDAPPTAFSSGRARGHIAAIAQRPHPIGSEEHARVRQYVVDELTRLGLTPEVQEATAFRAKYRPPRLAHVRNVVTRIAGRDASAKNRALLLMAHYDSRGMTPGASDDGFGTGALLEIARALTAGGPVERDVILLFSDGEEEGLLGATAFAESHRWAHDVAVVLNVDARGSSGPALMFQTGKGSGALIADLAANAGHIAANSLSQAIYQRMPNDTDLSVFLPDMPSLNFANVEGFERYHSPTDTLANIDEGTLQQGGEQMLGVARAVASDAAPLAPIVNPTYFNVGPFFVHYPAWLDGPLAVLAALATFAWIARSVRSGQTRARSVRGAAAVTLGLALGAAVASLALWLVADRVHADYRLMNAARPALKDLWLLTFATLALAIALVPHVTRRFSARDLFAGALVVVATLALAMTLVLPGAGFLFTWPALLASALALAFWRDGDLPRAPIAVALAAPVLVVALPFVPQIFVAFGPAVGAAVGLLVALIATFAAPALALAVAPAPRGIARFTLGASALALVAANVVSPFDLAYPRPDTVFYALDADAHEAFWMTPDLAPPSWTTVFANAGGTPLAIAPLPYPIGEVHAAPAPAPSSPLPSPTFTWLERAEGSGDAVLLVSPPPGAEVLGIRVDGVTTAELEGRSLVTEGGVAIAKVYAPPAAGVKLRLTGARGFMTTVRVASQRQGFPDGLTPGARPPTSIPKPGMLPPWEGFLESDTTLVVATTRF